MPESRRLILANGEKYEQDAKRTRRGFPTEMPRSYEAARDLVKREVRNALDRVKALPAHKRFEDETILCLRLHLDMMAKTYDPQGLFSVVPDLENVGSRNYHVSSVNVAQTKRVLKQVKEHVAEIPARLVFVRSNEAGYINRLVRQVPKRVRS